MRKRYIHNTSGVPIFVGGLMIPPDDGREIDEALLPPEGEASGEEQTQGEAPPDPTAALRELLKQSVKDLKALLTGLSTEDLATLQALESESETPRSSLLDAMAAEQLRRAAADKPVE